MSRARDFDHVPLDHTVPWRLGLPLPEVTVDSGPSTQKDLRDMYHQASFLREQNVPTHIKQSATDFCRMIIWRSKKCQRS